MLDFHGPAVATDVRNPSCLPVHLIGDAEDWLVHKVGLTMVNQQANFAEVLHAMRRTIAIITFFCSFVGDTDRTKDRSLFGRNGLLMFLLESLCKIGDLRLPLFKTTIVSSGKVPT